MQFSSRSSFIGDLKINLEVTHFSMLLFCGTGSRLDLGSRNSSESNNIVIVEPYYEGVLVPDVCKAMQKMPIRVEAIGVPHKVLSHYGQPEQHDEELGLTPRGIRHRIELFLASENNMPL